MLFCAIKKATVSRALVKRAPFLLLLSGTKEVNIKIQTLAVMKDKTSVETEVRELASKLTA